ncbi:uncharacterized protein B0I36DRAFT_338730 [Microdochium trichocladiopsis]|uniref:AAA+ ATPase domain-containing protein n=1 Tax=Microdochium trichocladiopsis TaxID=1682393 RepID=A0A9P8XS65_9PEZI|nr:uncharacterized protein B0I36DRAFT_338730 [Microdochium trichocladiopsis]KAH7014439.1 hypothetical protein B0I36DRAFT_338730 [Microdochium trichocladiopsis]
MTMGRSTEKTAALYNRVLSGRFIPESVDAIRTADTSAQPFATTQNDGDDPYASYGADGTSTSVPELKTVIQFKDPKGSKHVIEFQSYSFDKEDGDENGNAAEEESDPFRAYPVLLKAVIGSGKSLVWRLEIQNAGIVNVFREIAHNHKELDLTTTVLTIEHPFRCLFFLKDELEQRVQRGGGGDDASMTANTRIGLTQLVRFIRSPMCHEREIETYETQVVKQGRISFFMLWMIFRPYEPVVRIRPGQAVEDSQCFILESITPDYDGGRGGKPSWELILLFGTHNGSNYRVKTKVKKIEYFEGLRELTDPNLKFVPLRFLEARSQHSIREALIRRGKDYIEMCKQPYTVWKAKGPAYLLNSGKGEEIREQFAKKVIDLDERVIVDRLKQSSIGDVSDDRGSIVAYCLKDALPKPAPLLPTKSDGTPSEAAGKSKAPAKKETGPFQPGLVPANWIQKTGVWGDIDTTAYKQPKNIVLEDDDYMICRNVTAAFALKQKLWVKMVKVNHLSKIEYNGDPFLSLQMPSHKKQFIRRLVEGFRRSKDGSYDDVIEGKGRGLIFLLYGPPGLGKTLTAESVAEVAERPLYHISAGELSTKVSVLESELQTIFKMGARWDAVVLLDEADVLMSQRTTDNLERNSVVAVFLRMLEYYRGMLFLTTNRRDDFDDAFFNRIHVTLKYNELDVASRTNIWRHHLQRATRDNKERSLWTEEMYETLGRIQLNGRDIKNYVRVAYTYAHAVDGEDLGLEQVQAVLHNSLSSPGYALQRGSEGGEEGGVNSQEHVLQELDDLMSRARVSENVLGGEKE